VAASRGARRPPFFALKALSALPNSDALTRVTGCRSFAGRVSRRRSRDRAGLACHEQRTAGRRSHVQQVISCCHGRDTKVHVPFVTGLERQTSDQPRSLYVNVQIQRTNVAHAGRFPQKNSSRKTRASATPAVRSCTDNVPCRTVRDLASTDGNGNHNSVHNPRSSNLIEPSARIVCELGMYPDIRVRLARRMLIGLPVH
jgi:hypothetical protein